MEYSPLAWMSAAPNISELTKGHLDSKRWLYSLTTDAVRPAEIFQHFLFLLLKKGLEISPTDWLLIFDDWLILNLRLMSLLKQNLKDWETQKGPRIG